MKISQIISELESIREEYGEIDVALQNWPPPGEPITYNEEFFIVPEEYENIGMRCNIREWPY